MTPETQTSTPQKLGFETLINPRGLASDQPLSSQKGCEERCFTPCEIICYSCYATCYATCYGEKIETDDDDDDDE